MEWVHREQRRHERALPKRPGHSYKHKEQNNRIQYVEQDVYTVMPPRFQVEDRHIRHMGNPGDWMPIRGMECREGPGDSMPGQPLLDDGILVDVDVIVIVGKRVIPHLRVYAHNDRDQEKDDEERLGDPLPMLNIYYVRIPADVFVTLVSGCTFSCKQTKQQIRFLISENR